MGQPSKEKDEIDHGVDKQGKKEAIEKKKKEDVTPIPEKFVNLPYAKFLKEIFSNKRKTEETKVVKMTELCSGVLESKVLPK
ncbi:hypothetical protein ACH5RR_013000 [Cinchona calisaya]|uniref:Uncharacterized protein n=1 Tax=Cinchona calisaya TaxID=153742 RepID=A0ABD3A4I8_9GENT